MRILNWNVLWARSGTERGELIKRRISEQEPDVVCLTECQEDFLNGDGFVVTSAADYGYASPPSRRKVLLWSRNPWREVDQMGNDSLPGGRYVSAVTDTPLGPTRFLGVCIPWFDAHVNTGRRDRKKWEDHESYLVGLSRITERLESPSIMLGDFNQTIPRTRAPLPIFELLQSALDGRLAIATSGEIPVENKATIDHVAHTDDLIAQSVYSIVNQGVDGKPLSDHFGIVVDISNRSH